MHRSLRAQALAGIERTLRGGLLQMKCPACGSNEITWYPNPNGYSIDCHSCFAQTVPYDEIRKAAKSILSIVDSKNVREVATYLAELEPYPQFIITIEEVK